MNSIISVENVVLGCMLRSCSFLKEGCEDLQEKYFINKNNRQIFKLLCKINSENIDYIDIDIVKYHLELSDNKFVTKEYLDSLHSVGQPIKFASHLKTLKHNEYLREVSKIVDNKSIPISLINNNLNEQLIKFNDIDNNYVNPSIDSLLDSLNIDKFISGEEIEEEINKSVSSGFKELDKLISGLGMSNLIILAARPAMGKTALSLNIALNIARCKKSVGFLSLEMSKQQLLFRMLSSETEVQLSNIVNRSLGVEERSLLQDFIQKFRSYNLYIENCNSSCISNILSTIKSMKSRYNVDVIIIDYLQLITSMSQENRTQEISSISRKLKLIANELNIAIVCLSQLSRKVEDRPDKRPRMSDLRESGSIEQDADQVILMYRASYYDTDNINESNISDTVDIYVSKNRHGRTGRICSLFFPGIVKFKDYTPHVID